MMQKPNVLIDLSAITTAEPIPNVQQDTRNLFKSLSDTDTHNIIGLISGYGKEAKRLSYKKKENPIERGFSVMRYFYLMENSHKDHPLRIKKDAGMTPLKRHEKILLALAENIEKIPLYIKSLKNHYFLHTIDPIHTEYLWRKLFDGHIESDYQSELLQKQYMISDYSKWLISLRMLLLSSIKQAPYLHTSNIDFVIFQSPFPLAPRVTQNTCSMIRIHDTLALKYPDTIAESTQATLYIKALSASKETSYFVCTSEPVRHELLNLAPFLEDKSFVIPMALQDAQIENENTSKSISLITQTRRSTLYKKITPKESRWDEQSTYIITVSPIEPRHNYLSLLRAWEDIRYRHPELKLIMIGHIDKQSDRIVDAMRYSLTEGTLIHLDNVLPDELKTLTRQAKAFVLPTFYEGFCIEAIKALQVNCPVIVSDIPSNRWALKNAALYCNPYDISSITQSIEALLYDHNANERIASLRDHGKSVATLYSESSVRTQWLSLFDQIQSKTHAR